MINKRKIERAGYCRGCSKPIPKNTDIVYTKTYRGKNYFCLDCAKTIGELTKDNNESPDFDYFNYELILEWAEAKVEYNDEFVSHGIVTKIPEYGSYGLSWKNGYMRLDYNKDQEEAARKCAALFIYLWTRGINCSIAISCARLYVDNVTIKMLK